MITKSYIHLDGFDQEHFLNLVMQGYFSEAHFVYCNLLDQVNKTINEQTFGLIELEDFRRLKNG